MKSIFRFFTHKGKLSYSQCGEDMIVEFVLNSLKISNPSYLDIGAHHPTILNNTYLFYQKGSTGVCIEPDPDLYKGLKKKRKNDICLNVGVGATSQEKADFFIMSSSRLNTFSKKEALRYESYGEKKIVRVIQTPLLSLNDIVRRYFGGSLDFVSIDVEGMEWEILRTFDFTNFRPTIFCVETLTYTEDNSEKKVDEIAELMHENLYISYADTYINTIFVDQERWKSR